MIDPVSPTSKVAQEIVDVILSETFLNKNTLKPRIEAILKIFYNRQVLKPKPTNKSKDVDAYRMEVHRIGLESLYWKTELRKLIPDEEMKMHYSKIKGMNAEI